MGFDDIVGPMDHNITMVGFILEEKYQKNIDRDKKK